MHMSVLQLKDLMSIRVSLEFFIISYCLTFLWLWKIIMCIIENYDKNVTDMYLYFLHNLFFILLYCILVMQYFLWFVHLSFDFNFKCFN